MEVQILSYINGRENRIITVESSTQQIKDLIKAFCQKANIKPEDEHKVFLYYQAKELDPQAKICDCNLYCESAVTAVLKDLPAPVQAQAIPAAKAAPAEPPTTREIDYTSPPLPSNDKYFVYCPKHETGAEVNVTKHFLI